MKFVFIGFSKEGSTIPAFLPASIHFMDLTSILKLVYILKLITILVKM